MGITYNKSNYGEVVFEGVEYQLANDAYIDLYEGENAVFCNAITGEKDEDGDYLTYLVRWEYIEAEEMEDCADWGSPVDVVRY